MIDFEEMDISFTSFDGVKLQGTLSKPSGLASAKHAVLLIHGVQANRNETGFYSRMASSLSIAGISSFRFDWRCHGIDASRPIGELTLAGLLNDISSAWNIVKAHQGVAETTVISASFSGGASVQWARRNSSSVSQVILLNPVVDYLDEYISGQSKGDANQLTEIAMAELDTSGSLVSQRKAFSRAAVNEFRDFDARPDPNIPHWILHGDCDTGVSIRTSINFCEANVNAKLLVIPGAEHGFVEPGDWKMETPETLERHQKVYAEIVCLLKEGRSSGNFTTGGVTS